MNANDQSPPQNWKILENLIHEIVESQRETLLKTGRRLIPTLTSEDVLQPNDYPELEINPFFRYEEGVLAGMQTIQMAMMALQKDREDSFSSIVKNSWKNSSKSWDDFKREQSSKKPCHPSEDLV